MGRVIATYYAEADDLEEAAVAIAGEQSTGTWTDVTTAPKEIIEKYAAEVVSLDKEKGIMDIAFPVEDFSLEMGGISNILTIVAGNLFGLEKISNVRLLDVEFPEEIVSFFKGPNFGIEGVRKVLGTTKSRRPHVGTIVKPKIGLGPKDHANVVYEAAAGGLDLIKDDETLSNQAFNPLEDRMVLTMEALDRAQEETGRKALYAVNVTSDEVLESAQIAVDNGANCLMIDVITNGFPALSALSREFKLPIHVHRTMHGAMTRNRRHGIAMLVFSRLVRMAGGDQLHVGCAAGKMETPGVIKMHSALKDDWYGLNTVFPVCSGGVHPGLVEGNLKALGTDIVIQAGGGVHGHPDGTRAGAMAMMQAVEAFMVGQSLDEYAKDHKELAGALERWGKTTDYNY